MHDLTTLGGLEHEIQQFLKSELVPYVESHHGLLEFRSFADGVVRVHLDGACRHCSAQAITLKAGIERSLRKRFLEVDRVVLV